MNESDIRIEPALTTPSPALETQPNPVDPEHSSRKWIGLAMPVLISSVVSMALIAPAFYALASHRPKPLATVDLQKLVQDANTQYLASFKASHSADAPPSASDVQAGVTQSANFARQLSGAVEQLGHDCDCVLINKAAVLNSAGLTDYTVRLADQLHLNAKDGH